MMDRPLRFCMITTFYPPYNFGGDGIYVHRLANELARRGHQVEVIHCLDAYNLLARRAPSQDYADHPNVTVHGLKSPWGLLSPLVTQQTGFPFFKSARIRQILDKGFDVINYHNISLVGGPKILEYGRGVKLYSIHEHWLICPTNTLFKFIRSPCTRPQCLACSLLYKRPPQWWRYFGLLTAALKQVDAFITPNRFCKSIYEQMDFTAPFVQIPYFVSVEGQQQQTFDEAVGESAPQKPYFLFVGRLEKLKGLQTLIPIFRQYGKAQLLVAGKGSYEQQLRQLAEGCASIRFLGHLSDGQLQAVCRQAVALIVPSLTYEVFALVVVEAFRVQTPVIARNLGGMREMVEESGGGIVYNTSEELVAAMELLLSNPSLRVEMGWLGYKAFQRRWTPEIHLQKYLGLIRKIQRNEPV
jgi:glycosyltransferase involved in cell wall biosynthesis